MVERPDSVSSVKSLPEQAAGLAPAISLGRLTALLFVCLTVVGAVFAVQNWIVGGPYGQLTWPRNIMVALTQWWSWAAFAPAVILLSVRYPLLDPPRRQRIVFYLALCAAVLLLNVALVTAIERATDRVTPGEDLELTAANLFTKRLGINLVSLAALVMLGQAVVYHARWRRSTDVAAESQKEPGKQAAPNSSNERPARLAVSDGNRTLMVDAGDVVWIEAAGNYSVIHTGAARHIARATLSELEQTFGDRLARVSRSALVSIHEITAITGRTQQGDAMLVLRSGQQVRLTRTFRRAVLDRLPTQV